MQYSQIFVRPDAWIVCDISDQFANPSQFSTASFDTETLTLYEGKKIDTDHLLEISKNETQSEMRMKLECLTWSWQAFSEETGFFMTNSFDIWLDWLARARAKYVWCYNASFDFSQIDYHILSDPKWKPMEKRIGKGYNRGQPWRYSSLHNDQGARYSYKLWIPYRSADRHQYVHAIEFRDFMKIVPGGLGKLLKDMNITAPDGTPIRKLEMEYQAVDPSHLTCKEIEYCRVDVVGLYYAIKRFDQIIRENTNGERRIFGDDTNVMTAGGLAKSELLRFLYPDLSPKQRIKRFQKVHPITASQDKYIRDNHLYRGGLCLVNPRYQGKMLDRPLNRYDVNSEYPYIMATITDLIGEPIIVSPDEFRENPRSETHVAIFAFSHISAELRDGMIPSWYDHKSSKYVLRIDEDFTHLIFEEEFNELSYWYDIEYTLDYVLLIKKGERVFAPFVEHYYAIKQSAKRDKNGALGAFAKLMLNSSYGKLSERIERATGHYEINELTGAVHFVSDGCETSETGRMSIYLGAYVTAMARTFILGKVREICKIPAETFVYMDTDSIHTFDTYEKADAYSLGGLKHEAICPFSKYIMPKTYIDIEEVTPKMKKVKKAEIHSKGVSPKIIWKYFPSYCTIKKINAIFDYGLQVFALCAMNVKGGKVLVYLQKYVARPDQKINDDLFVTTGYSGTLLSER